MSINPLENTNITATPAAGLPAGSVGNSTTPVSASGALPMNINPEMLKKFGLTVEEFLKLSPADQQMFITEFNSARTKDTLQVRGLVVEKVSISPDKVAEANVKLNSLVFPSPEAWKKMTMDERREYVRNTATNILKDVPEDKREKVYLNFLDKAIQKLKNVPAETWNNYSEEKKTKIRHESLLEFNAIVDKGVTRKQWDNLSPEQKLELQIKTLESYKEHDEDMHVSLQARQLGLKSGSVKYKNGQYIFKENEKSFSYKIKEELKAQGIDIDTLSQDELNNIVSQKLEKYLKNSKNQRKAFLEIISNLGSEKIAKSFVNIMPRYKEQYSEWALKNSTGDKDLDRFLRSLFAETADKQRLRANKVLAEENVKVNDLETAFIQQRKLGGSSNADAQVAVSSIYYEFGNADMVNSATDFLVNGDGVTKETKFAIGEIFAQNSHKMGAPTAERNTAELYRKLSGQDQLKLQDILSKKSNYNINVLKGSQNAVKGDIISEGVEVVFVKQGHDDTANIKDEKVRAEAQKGWVDTTPYLQANHQAEVFDYIAKSDVTLKNVLEYAAENISKLDESAQPSAYKSIIDSGDEKAILAAAKQYQPASEQTVRQVEDNTTQKVVYETAETLARVDSTNGTNTQKTLEQQKQEYVKKFTESSPKEQFEMIDRLGDAQQKSAITAIVMFAPSMLEGLIGNGFGPKILSVPGIPSEVIYKVIDTMVKAGGTKRTEAYKYILKNNSLFRDDTIKKARESLNADKVKTVDSQIKDAQPKDTLFRTAFTAQIPPELKSKLKNGEIKEPKFYFNV